MIYGRAKSSRSLFCFRRTLTILGPVLHVNFRITLLSSFGNFFLIDLTIVKIGNNWNPYNIDISYPRSWIISPFIRSSMYFINVLNFSQMGKIFVWLIPRYLIFCWNYIYILYIKCVFIFDSPVQIYDLFLYIGCISSHLVNIYINSKYIYRLLCIFYIENNIIWE